MLLVGFLVVRNQPFHDPNLVVLIRTVLSTAVAEAFRHAQEVLTRDALPQQWAAIQNNLGDALYEQGERLGGAEAARSLGESAEAFRHALEVFTREALPRDRAMTLSNLGRTLQAQAIRVGFPECLKQIEGLARDQAISDDPAAGAALQTLAIACRVGLDQVDGAGRDLDALTGWVGRQPADFRLGWDWEPLGSFLARSESGGIRAHRGALLRLMDAASRGNRAAILAGLKDAKAGLATGAGVPKEAPRK